MYSQILVIMNFLNLFYNSNDESVVDISMYRQTTYLIITILVELAFMLFNVVVFFDQITVVLNRLSPVDKVRLQGNRLKRIKKRGYENFMITFGEAPSIMWLWPSPITRDFTIEELYN